MSSSHHGDMKFMLLLQSNSLRAPYSGFPGANPPSPPDTSGGSQLAAWGSYVATQMADPQYVTIYTPNGPKKPLGLFLCELMPASQWATLKAALNRSDVYTFCWNRATAAGTTLALNGMTEYPPNPGVISGAGQHPYTDIITGDQGYSAPAGFLTTALITATQDGRAFATPSAVWADQPTQVQWVQHVRTMRYFRSSGVASTFVDVHALNEYAEDGYFDAAQEGGRYFTGILCAKTPASCPSTQTYGLSTESNAFTRTGAGWARTQQLTTSSWSNMVMTDSTAADTISLAHIAQTAGAIYGDKCSGCGQFTVQLDASTVATVSTSNGSTLHHQLLWSSGALTQASHTVQATIVGNGAVSLDEFEVTFNPQAIP